MGARRNMWWGCWLSWRARTLGSGVVRPGGEVWQGGGGLAAGEGEEDGRGGRQGLGQRTNPSPQLLSHSGKTTGENVNTLISSFPISRKTNGKGGQWSVPNTKSMTHSLWPFIFPLGRLQGYHPQLDVSALTSFTWEMLNSPC